MIQHCSKLWHLKSAKASCLLSLCVKILSNYEASELASALPNNSLLTECRARNSAVNHTRERGALFSQFQDTTLSTFGISLDPRMGDFLGAPLEKMPSETQSSSSLKCRTRDRAGGSLFPGNWWNLWGVLYSRLKISPSTACHSKVLPKNQNKREKRLQWSSIAFFVASRSRHMVWWPSG